LWYFDCCSRYLHSSSQGASKTRKRCLLKAA
jgi:hypothetical protein